MCNVTLRRVRGTVVAVEKKYVLKISVCVCVCVRLRECVCMRAPVCGYMCKDAGTRLFACSLTYSAWYEQAPYCLLPLWLHHICRRYLINGKIFGKTLLRMKCVFWFSIQLLSKTLFVLRTIQQDTAINMKTFLRKLPLILVRF